MKNKTKKIIVSLSVMLVVVSLFFSFKSDLFRTSKNIDIFINIYKQVNQKYVDEVPPSDLMQEGIRSMLRSLDPYTEYYPESALGDYKMHYVNESYGGIGAASIIRDNKIIISDVFENSPAHNAKLRSGDVIHSINDIEVTKLNLDELAKKLKGGRGTVLKLKINRNKSLIDISIKRDKILLPSVSYYSITHSNIGYIQLNRFVEHSTDEVVSAVKALQKIGMKGLILDLRNNGGGLLNEAVKIVNLFVPKGQIVVYQRGRSEHDEYIYKTQSDPLLPNLPLVILMNKNSASASEVVSGALQDLDRAVILGQKSFGKALVQQTIDMPYNSLLKITIGKYYTPSGRCLQAIDYTSKEKDGTFKNLDKQLAKPFKTKSNREIYNAGGVAPDVYFEPQKNNEVLNVLFSEYVFFDFANQYSYKHKFIQPVDKFEITDALFEEFLQFVLSKKELELNTSSIKVMDKLEKSLKDKNQFEGVKKEFTLLKNKFSGQNKSLILKHKKAIKEQLANNIISTYYLNSGLMQYNLIHSSFIQKASDLLSDTLEYHAILSGEDQRYKRIGKITASKE